MTAAKALRDFARTNPNLVAEGRDARPAAADAPPTSRRSPTSRPATQLLARLAGGFQAPLVKAAGLFQAFTRNMAYGVKALIDQRVAAGEALPDRSRGPEPSRGRRARGPAAEAEARRRATEDPAPATENDEPAAEATEPAQASENRGVTPMATMSTTTCSTSSRT